MSEGTYFDVCVNYKTNASSQSILYANGLADALRKAVDAAAGSAENISLIEIKDSDMNDEYCGWGY